MIAIVDYGMGNVGSVKNALEFLGATARVSNNQNDLKQASHIILPGVGAFGDGIKNLKKRGLISVLTHEVFERKKPFLGICLGMQLLATVGEEGGTHSGLGWIPGTVRQFEIDKTKFRVPHMGWNDVSPKPEATLFTDISSRIFYFVHSFILVSEEKGSVSATCEYGEVFIASIEKGNIFGVQFHPEKSQKSGLKLLTNFLHLRA
ncbi:MAG: imidazole glycerol phosphate synthase subunit hisH [Parcubacteria group bacterium Greene0416_79]|nr:MAG: imidazole glycerol phosphate synthase subunit hisH [Parcubacteria group bacterium Greene0416_79]